ncbi:MAG: hypothetical protein RI947_395 [Candidatus Parcubacteria bacterium]|jgi:hypothetical protein
MNLKKIEAIPAWVYISLLMLISAVLVFYKFSSIPQNLAFDEVDSTQLATYLGTHPFTLYSPLATGHATPYYYLILASFKLFDTTVFALRLPAALFGIINIAVFFLIIKLIFKTNYIAFIFALLLITTRWYLNFSRFSFEATFLLTLELFSIYFMFENSKHSNRIYAVISAVFAGLAFYSYLPGRIFFLVPLSYIFFMRRKTFAMYVVVLTIIIAPLVIYFTRHPDVRMSQVSVLTNNRINSLGKVSIVGQNTLKSAQMLFTKGDMNGRHNYPGKPALNIVMSLFFISGLIRIFYIKRDRYSLLFLFYIAIAIIPTLLTPLSDNPNMLRTFTALPGIIYFIGNGVIMLSQIKITGFQKPVFICIACLVLFSILYDMRTYFVFQSRVFRNAFEVNCPLEKLSKWSYTYVPKTCRVQQNEF